MILRFPGGKNKSSIKRIITSHFPSYFDEYREPFCGSAGIFWTIPKNIARWINDIDPDLMSLYQALQTRPKEFIDSCRSIEPEQKNEEAVHPKSSTKGKRYNKRLKETFDYFANNESCDQALRYFFVNRTVWGGRVRYDLPSRMYFSNPSGWNIVKTDKLEKAAEALSLATITCGNYINALSKPALNHNGQVLIYLDPPYYKDTELNLHSKLYRYGFSHQEHAQLMFDVLNCKHKVLMSYDDHPVIREFYSRKPFVISEAEWTYCGSSQKKKTVGKELIIKNY